MDFARFKVTLGPAHCESSRLVSFAEVVDIPTTMFDPEGVSVSAIPLLPSSSSSPGKSTRNRGNNSGGFLNSGSAISSSGGSAGAQHHGGSSSSEVFANVFPDLHALEAVAGNNNNAVSHPLDMVLQTKLDGGRGKRCKEKEDLVYVGGSSSEEGNASNDHRPGMVVLRNFAMLQKVRAIAY